MGRDAVGEPGVAGPRRLGAFVGRRTEVRRLRQLVAAGAPLITVTGLSGVGKTRLVDEALGGLVDAWLSAADLDNPAALLPLAEQRADALSASGGPDRQVMVIDSMDDAELGRQVISITDRYQGIQVVVTSQTRLNVRGEVLLRLEPLAYPSTPADVDPGNPAQWPAIECFVHSARRVRPGFELAAGNVGAVVELVGAAGGLPLALDVITNWLRLLSVQELALQARGSLEPFRGGAIDLPLRHQDLAASILAVVQALPEQDAELLRSVAHLGAISLRGLSAALGRPAALESLGRMVDRNLVEVSGDNARISMHPMVRRVVTSQSDGFEVQRRFLSWLAGLVKASATQITTAQSRRALADLEALAVDVTAGLDLVAVQPDAVAVLIADLQEYWTATRQAHVQLYATTTALERLDPHHPLAGRLHLGAARASRLLCLYPAVVAHAEQATTAARLTGDSRLVAEAVAEIERGRVQQGDFADPGPAQQEAISLCEELGLHRTLCDLWVTEIGRLLHVGRRAEALDLAERTVELTRGVDDLASQVPALQHLAYAHTELGNFEMAEKTLDEALAVARPAHPRCALEFANHLYLSACLGEQGRFAEAVEAARSAVAGYAEVEWPLGLNQACSLLAENLSKLGQFDEAREQFIRSLELSRGSSMNTALVAIAISRIEVRPSLELCDLILTSVEAASPGFIDGQFGDWRVQLAAIRAEIAAATGDSKQPAAVPLESLVDTTLRHLRAARAPSRPLGLTRRELEVLSHLALGETDGEIAGSLHIGTRTVNSHVSTILRKLGVTRRRQAAAWARANLHT